MKVGVGTAGGIGARVRAPPSSGLSPITGILEAYEPGTLRCVIDISLLAPGPQFPYLHSGGSHGPSGGSSHLCLWLSLSQGSAGLAGRPGNPGHQGPAVSMMEPWRPPTESCFSSSERPSALLPTSHGGKSARLGSCSSPCPHPAWTSSPLYGLWPGFGLIIWAMAPAFSVAIPILHHGCGI